MKNTLFLFSLLLIGCGSIKPKATINIPDLTDSEGNISIVDKRPQIEKESISFGKNPFSCAFGIDRYGDDRLVPNKVRLLQHRTFVKFKNGHSMPKQIVVNKFVVYHNNQAWARKTGEEMNGVELYWGKFNNPDCKPPEVLLAYFTEEENPNLWPIFIVYLDAEIDNKNTRIRLPFAYLNDASSNSSFQISAVEQAIDFFLSHY